MANTGRRYTIWRRAPEDLYDLNGVPAIGSLGNKIEEAQSIVEDGDYETVLVLRIEKIVTSRVPVNVVVRDFKPKEAA